MMIRCAHCDGKGAAPLRESLQRVLDALTDEPQTAREVHERCGARQTVSAVLAQLRELCAMGLAQAHPEMRHRPRTRPAAQYTRRQS